MFLSNCRAIFRVIFEKMECTIDNAFNLLDIQAFVIMDATMTSYHKLKGLSIVHYICSNISLNMALELGRNM